uniref:DNA repair endonuclease XPF n=1 Tax=Siphoviridae sp. ctZ1O5 TaxID=2825555 RepID=A0A8S5PG16_9CAUD|nr:MAG TPA: DNA repair endonuclease XPF [Siphoviridae sp. ctZ1O5]
MLKPLNFGNYQALKRYSFNQMNQWATSVYVSGFQDGQDSMPTVLEFDPNTLEEFLLGIDGIGAKTVRKIVQAFIDKGESAWELDAGGEE